MLVTGERALPTTCYLVGAGYIYAVIPNAMALKYD
jgi:hypothetical protein